MKNGLSFLPVVALLGLLAPAVLRADEAAGRERIRFDDGWKFHLLDDTVPEAAPTTAPGGVPVPFWRWKLADNPAAETPDVTRPDFDERGVGDDTAQPTPPH